MTTSSMLPIDSLKAEGKPIPSLISPRYILGNAQKWIYIRQSDMLQREREHCIEDKDFFCPFFPNETRKRRKLSKSGEKQSQSVKEKK